MTTNRECICKEGSYQHLCRQAQQVTTNIKELSCHQRPLVPSLLTVSDWLLEYASYCQHKQRWKDVHVEAKSTRRSKGLLESLRSKKGCFGRKREG